MYMVYHILYLGRPRPNAAPPRGARHQLPHTNRAKLVRRRLARLRRERLGPLGFVQGRQMTYRTAQVRALAAGSRVPEGEGAALGRDLPFSFFNFYKGANHG